MNLPKFKGHAQTEVQLVRTGVPAVIVILKNNPARNLSTKSHTFFISMFNNIQSAKWCQKFILLHRHMYTSSQPYAPGVHTTSNAFPLSTSLQ